jgi:hypothetical protein
MSKDNKIVEYDEDDSVRFIRKHLSEEMRNSFSDDEINYVVDLMYDFYDEKGFLDGDDDTEVEIDEDELLDYVIKTRKRIKVRDFKEEEIEAIVAGELAYCDSLNLFRLDDKTTLFIQSQKKRL